MRSPEVLEGVDLGSANVPVGNENKRDESRGGVGAVAGIGTQGGLSSGWGPESGRATATNVGRSSARKKQGNRGPRFGKSETNHIGHQLSHHGLLRLDRTSRSDCRIGFSDVQVNEILLFQNADAPYLPAVPQSMESCDAGSVQVP